MQKKIERAEIWQFKSFDCPFADPSEMFLDALGSHLANQHWIEIVTQCNQRRPVSNDLLNLWPASGKTSHTRWPGQYQWRDLFGESLYRGAILTAHADAQLNFRQVRRRFRSQRAMRRIRTNKFRQDLIKLQPQPIQTRPQYPVCGPCLVVSLP